MRCFIPAAKGRRRLEDISSPSNIRTGTCRKVYIVVFTICEFQLFCQNLCVLSESSEWPVPRFRFLLDGLHLLLGWTPQHRWRYPAVWKLDKFVHFVHTWTPCALAPWLKPGPDFKKRFLETCLVFGSKSCLVDTSLQCSGETAGLCVTDNRKPGSCSEFVKLCVEAICLHFSNHSSNDPSCYNCYTAPLLMSCRWCHYY